MAALREKLEALISSKRTVQVAVAAKRLPSGEEVLIQADRAFHPASTVKLCIMMEVFHQARRGVLALDESIRILNSFRSLADGESYALNPADDSEKGLYDAIGSSLPVRELIERMITVSSNLATNLLLARVGAEQTTDFVAQLSAPSLRIIRGMEDKAAYRKGLNNSGTAHGFMTVLTKLARGEVVSPQDSDEMLAILGRQKLNEMIPAGLPAGTRVAHKTGWMADYYHDVGIVYPTDGRPFVLAILTRGYPESESTQAHAFIAELARAVYEAWT